MSNVITVRFTDRPTLHCGPNCHQETDFDRQCICQGLNTGLGLDMAVANCRKYQKLLRDRLFKEFPDATSIRITTRLRKDHPDQRHFDATELPFS